MKTLRLLVVALLAGACLIVFDAPAVDRYVPGELVSSRKSGTSTPITAADWPARRAQILAAMQKVMGPLPDRSHLAPLDVKVLAETRGDGFVRQTIEYTSEVDAKTGKPERVPAFLFIPTNLKPGEKRPAILALHPTSKLGKAEIIGEGKPNRGYGLELALRGFVVLCPDYPSFGDYPKDFAASFHPSGTMQGIVNHMRGVDLLCERSEVDPNRIGVIGHSLGGHNSLFVAAFDPRIKAIVTCCGWNVFEDYYKGNLAGWASDRYMPRIRTEYGLDPRKMPFDFHEVLAAIAPRPVLSISALQDSNFAVEGVRKGIAAAKPVYALLGAPDALQVEYPNCAHDFPPEMREKAYAFLDKELKQVTPKNLKSEISNSKSQTSDSKSEISDSKSEILDLKSEISNLKSALPAKADAPAAPAPAAGAKKPATRDFAAELQRVPAKSPAEAEKCIQCLPGYHAKLVASEPLVFSPVAIDFDENGRAFVCEMIDYPFVAPEPMGKISILEDTDSDGVYDKRTVLADKIPWPTAVLCYDGGCFVGSAPDILYIKDTGARPSPAASTSGKAGEDARAPGKAGGDAGVPGGTADVRKFVFTGFGKQNVQGLLNSFRWGIDNRIHGATSTNGGKVRRADLAANDPNNVAIDLRGRDFSFDPRKLDLRPESGGGQNGMCFDDFGRKFVCSNSDHLQQIIYEDRYATKSAPVPLPPARVSIAADGPQAEVFRISPVEAWRVIRTQMRVSGESKGIIEGGGRAAGYFTGATGVMIYRGDACPELRGQAFVGDVGSNLVSRKTLVSVPDSVLLRGERIDQNKEFLASTDIWFRPAQMANAPDGTLWVLDVCREVIEHPDSLPDVIKQHLDLTSGRDRGRIYRVVPDGYEQKPVPKLGKMTTAELVKLLEHPNEWHRETAARLLYERHDVAAVPGLRKLQLSSSQEAHICSMYALASLGKTKELVEDINLHFDGGWNAGSAPEVLEHALRLSEGLAAKFPSMRDLWLPGDSTPELDLQRALTIHEKQTLGGGGAHSAELAQILLESGDDRYVRAAALNSLDSVTDAYWYMLEQQRWKKEASSPVIFRELSRLAVLRGDAKDLSGVSKAIDAILIDNDPRAARQAVAGLMEALNKADPSLREAAAQGRVPDLMKNIVKDSASVAADVHRQPAERAEAAHILSLGSFEESRQVLVGLLGGQEPQEVQLAAIAALDPFGNAEVGQVLTDAWPRLTPRLRAAARDVIFRFPGRVIPFLTAIDQGKIPLGEIEPARLKRMQESQNFNIRKLAAAIAKKSALSPRNDVIAAYKKALDLKGDREKGKAIFTQTCATCHKLENIGIEIGPNLAAMQARGPEAILVNVLDPSREVNGQYVEYVVDTKDGRTISGLLASETSAAVTLRKPGGATETVARNEIEKLRSTGLSLMPEGFERQLTEPQQMADLLAYLMTAK